MGTPLIQIVNEQDEPIGEASIQEAQEKGLIHRISRVMVEDEDGRILLQKRSDSRGLYPNCWDNSAAGHVDAGETYKVAAKREAAEEIGLIAVPFHEIGYYQSKGSFEWRQLNRFSKVYKATVKKDTDFVIEPDEVSEVKWFTRTEIKQLITAHPEKMTDGVIEVFKRYY